MNIAYQTSTEAKDGVLKILSFLALIAHFLYFIIFFIIDNDMLAVTNVFSVIIYIFITTTIVKGKQNSKLSIAIFQFEVSLHALLCIIVLGWNCGFELLFMVLILLMLFVDNSYKNFTYFMTLLQLVLFVGCYYLFGDVTRVDESWREFLFVFNLLVVCALAIILSYLLEISNQLAYINAQKQKDDAKSVSSQDPLTKLSNRHGFERFVKSTLLNSSKSFAVVIGDIDDFKKANDTYGHDVGDMILVRVANMFKNIFRKDDFICRWGGEEFLAVVYDIDKNGALNVVKRIKDNLNSTTLKYDNKEIKITMTFGLVFHDGYGEFDIEKMIKKADELLYQGKKTGKNKIVFE